MVDSSHQGTALFFHACLYRRRLREGHKVRAALDRLIPDVAGEGIRHADVVIEAVPENLELKHKIYRDAESRMKPDALLATNTSSIPLEDLGKALARPERLIGLHFFNPVAQMPLLEVVRGEGSGAETVEAGLAFARAIDKLPLPVRSAPGFLVNRALTPYLMAAVQLLDDGQPPAAIDEAAEAFGMPMGPLELADAVGLDICLHVGEILGGMMAGGVGWQPPKGLTRLIEQGHLGRKSGQGFYRYDKRGKPIKAKPQASSAAPSTAPSTAQAELQDRLLLPPGL